MERTTVRGQVRPGLRGWAAAAGAALVTALLVALAPASGAAAGDGTPTDPNIGFVGRWDTSNSAAYVPHWAGAYLVTGFTGTSVALRQRGAIDLYYSIDGAAVTVLRDVSGTVGLTPNRLGAGTHTLMVSYRVVAGSYTGDAVFQGLVLDAGARTVPVAVPSRLAEFVGDSITVGQTSSQVALTAYPWLVGEQLGTRHTQIAQGGATSSSASGTGGCAASYGLSSSWPGGFVAGVTVTASSALTGWKVTLTLPPGAAVATLWGGVSSGTTGTVTVTNAAYNGSLVAGQATSFGFQGTGDGTGATVTCAAA